MIRLHISPWVAHLYMVANLNSSTCQPQQQHHMLDQTCQWAAMTSQPLQVLRCFPKQSVHTGDALGPDLPFDAVPVLDAALLSS